MKTLLKQMFTWIGVACTAGTIVIMIFYALNEYNMVPESLSSFRRDPIYQVNLAGDSPQIVHQVKVGDDVVPLIYQTWYNPKTGEYTDFIVEVE